MTTSPLQQPPLNVSAQDSMRWPGAQPRSEPQRRLGIPVLPPDQIGRGLRQGAGFAAFFGTLWLVQGLLPLVGVLAFTSLVPGLCIAGLLARSRRPARGTTDKAGRGSSASRYVASMTATQLVLSVTGGVALQLIAPADTVLPFVILTVGAYLLCIAPALGAPHVAATGLILCLLSTVAAGAYAERLAVVVSTSSGRSVPWRRT